VPSLNSFLAFLLFLGPLTIYFVAMGLINSRQRPLILPGVWDFVGVLVAVSGFLFFGGPSILAWANERWHLAQLFSHSRTNGPGYYFWLGLWVVYFLAVLGVAAVALNRRRNQLAIYNVAPDAFNESLALALDRLGLAWSRSGQQVYISYVGEASPAKARLVPAHSPASAGAPAGAPMEMVPETAGHVARLELEPSRAMRHVTLSFAEGSEPLRQEIESELSQALAQVQTTSNPAGVWFMVVAALLFVLMCFLVLGAAVVSGLLTPA
jgi:hypothetical protein